MLVTEIVVRVFLVACAVSATVWWFRRWYRRQMQLHQGTNSRKHSMLPFEEKLLDLMERVLRLK